MSAPTFAVHLELATGKFAKGARAAGRETDALGKVTKKTSAAVKKFAKALAPLGVSAAAIVAIRALAAETLRYGTALREVGTLIPGQKAELEAINRASLALVATYGGMPTDQAKAFYQAISAGAGSAAEATEILDVANRLAIGGLTPLGVGIDGLTSILNAYGMEATKAESVSDALFVAMRAGKTTVSELSSDVGRLAPIASQAGVGIDELLAAVSALTKGGLSTSESMTGVRGILVSIIKPSQEAAEYAEQLGIQFDTQALKSKGLVGVLDDVARATKGDADEIAKLFPNVEALTPALALAGAAGKDFSDILDQMADRAGATQTAFEEMAESAEHKWSVLKGKLVADSMDILNAIKGGIVRGFELITEYEEPVVTAITAISIALLSKYVPAMTSATAINTAFTASLAVISAPLTATAAIVGGMAVTFSVFTKKIGEQSQAMQEAAGSGERYARVLEAIGSGDVVRAQAETTRAIQETQIALEKAKQELQFAEIQQANFLKGGPGWIDAKDRVLHYGTEVNLLEAQLHKLGKTQDENIEKAAQMAERSMADASGQEMLRILKESAGAASDLTDELEAAGDAGESLQEKIAEQIRINALLELELEIAGDYNRLVQETFEEAFDGLDVTDATEAAIQGALNDMEIYIPSTEGLHPENLQTGFQDEEGIFGGIAGVMDMLADEIGGLEGTLLSLVTSFARLASTMGEGGGPAGDWIGLIAQAAHAIRMSMKARKEERKEIEKTLRIMQAELRMSNNELEAATDSINRHYDAIEKALMKAVGTDLLRSKVAGELSDMQMSQIKRQLELAAATRKVQEQGFSGLETMFEDLGIYLTDTEHAMRFAQELDKLRLEMEIINFRIQLDMLKSLGTIAQETLSWIESMIDVVEAGLRDGSLTVGGVPGETTAPVAPRRPRPTRSGPNPRETLADLLDTMDQWAGIVESTFSQIEQDTMAALEHVAKMRISEEERSAVVDQILDRQARAHEELGQALIERVYRAIGDEEKLADLERTRFDLQRIRDLEEIDALLEAGNLTEEMRESLEEGREALAGFEWPEPPPPEWVDRMTAILEPLRSFMGSESDAQRLINAMNEAYRVAVEVSETQGELALNMLHAFGLAQQAAEKIAFGMIDSLASAVGSEEDIARVAELRHFMEVQAYRTQAELLRPLLDSSTYEWLVGLIDAFEAIDPNEVIEGVEEAGATWQDFLDSLSGISQQTSEAEELWNAWLAASQAATDLSDGADEYLKKLTQAWDLANEAAEKIAFGMIESLAQRVGSEEDIARVAELRHFMEVQSYKAQAALLAPLLDPSTYAWLIALIDDFENMDLNPPGTNPEIEPSPEIDTTKEVEDQREAIRDIVRSLRLGGEVLLDQVTEYYHTMRQAIEDQVTSYREIEMIIERMSHQVGLSALDLIDAAVRMSGSEVLAAKASAKRFAIEKALLLAEIAAMRITIDMINQTIGGFDDLLEMLDEAYGAVRDSVYTAPDIPDTSPPSPDITDAIDDQTDDLINALSGLQDAMNDVLIGDLSPLSQEQQWERLQAERDQLIAAARSGDLEAMQELQQFVGQYASFLEAYSGGTSTAFYAQELDRFFGQLSTIDGIDNPLAGMSIAPLMGLGSGEYGGNVIGSPFDFRPDLTPMVSEQAYNNELMEESNRLARENNGKQDVIIDEQRRMNDRLDALERQVA